MSNLVYFKSRGFTSKYINYNYLRTDMKLIKKYSDIYKFDKMQDRNIIFDLDKNDYEDIYKAHIFKPHLMKFDKQTINGGVYPIKNYGKNLIIINNMNKKLFDEIKKDQLDLFYEDINMNTNREELFYIIRKHKFRKQTYDMFKERYNDEQDYLYMGDVTKIRFMGLRAYYGLKIIDAMSNETIKNCPDYDDMNFFYPYDLYSFKNNMICPTQTQFRDIINIYDNLEKDKKKYIESYVTLEKYFNSLPCYIDHIVINYNGVFWVFKCMMNGLKMDHVIMAYKLNDPFSL